MHFWEFHTLTVILSENVTQAKNPILNDTCLYTDTCNQDSLIPLGKALCFTVGRYTAHRSTLKVTCTCCIKSVILSANAVRAKNLNNKNHLLLDQALDPGSFHGVNFQNIDSSTSVNP